MKHLGKHTSRNIIFIRLTAAATPWRTAAHKAAHKEETILLRRKAAYYSLFHNVKETVKILLHNGFKLQAKSAVIIPRAHLFGSSRENCQTIINQAIETRQMMQLHHLPDCLHSY